MNIFEDPTIMTKVMYVKLVCLPLQTILSVSYLDIFN